ncbi:MAG: DUF4139 domain-containing protein [Planctomycetota bacterium]|jgi:hypothetical protein
MFGTMKIRITALLLLLAMVVPAFGDAGLVTIPKRDKVQLTIYNSEDLTLVKESRYITFKKGINKIQFAWAGTLIDPTSADLRAVEHPDRLEILDTSYPPNRNDALEWHVQCDEPGQYLVEVEYFTSGLTWGSSYVLVANPDETQVHFKNDITITNNSGEDYADAETRVVVGTVNLVEKIRQLAQGVMKGKAEGEIRREAAQRWMDKAAKSRGAGRAPAAARPKQVIKEGLSEYFIYTIEGTETVLNRWAKRLRSLEKLRVPVTVSYRYDVRKYGRKPVKVYRLKNDEKSKLGETPLPDGQVRVFRQVKGSDDLGYLGQASTKYVPIDSEFEINLGADDEVTLDRKKIEHRITNLSFNRWNNVDGWDQIEKFETEIANFGTRARKVLVRRYFSGDFDIDFAKDFPGEIKKENANTYLLTFDVKPGEKFKYSYKLTTRLGKNAKKK